MSETLSNNAETINENKSTFEQEMSDVPTFDEQKKRNQAERLQRVLELAKITEARKDDEAFDEAIQNLDTKQSFNLLNHINGILRGAKRSERGRRGNMRVGDYLAPQGSTQKAMLSETTEALKDIKDNHYRATLSYYMINALHLFGDGNGRTSRAVYEIFDSPDFDLADKRVIHEKGDSIGGVDQADFETEKGIRSTRDALWLASAFIKEQAFESGKIDNVAKGINMRIEAPFGEIYFTPDAEKELSSKEKKAVANAFQFNQDTGVLALCGILTEKDSLKSLLSKDGQAPIPHNFTFQVEADNDRIGEVNDEARRIFDGWTADDYRRFVSSAAGAHRAQLRTLIGFFRTPEQYTFDNGEKVADWLCEAQD